jgi:hypothetical protein
LNALLWLANPAADGTEREGPRAPRLGRQHIPR